MVNMISKGEMGIADFHVAIKWLCDISQQHEDQWSLHHATCVTPVQEVYASKQSFKKLLLCEREMPLSAENCRLDVSESLNNVDKLQHNTLLDMCGDSDDDDACLYQSSLSESVDYTAVCQLDHHILYSHSYSVPVLYFNAYTSGGQLLSLQELWRIVSDTLKLDAASTDLWKLVTQQEHPLLRRPYFHLHPCHTAELMAQLQRPHWSPMHYLLSWLSTVAHAVLLDLPLCYATQLTTCSHS